MSEETDLRDATQAQSIALMALNDLLVGAGLIERGALAAQLRRFVAPEDRQGLATMIEGLARSLEAEHFTMETPRLTLAVDNSGDGDVEGT